MFELENIGLLHRIRADRGGYWEVAGGRGEVTFEEVDIGIFPEDWRILTLEEATEKIIDYRGKTPKKQHREYPLLLPK